MHAFRSSNNIITLILRAVNCNKIKTLTATTLTNHRNDQPSSSTSEDVIVYKQIGVIETTFQNKRGVPRQPSVMAKAKGVVIIDQSVFNNPEHALSGLEEFSHMW